MTPLAILAVTASGMGLAVLCGLGGAIALAVVDRRELAGRVPVSTVLGLVWLRFPAGANEERGRLAKALSDVLAAYQDALDALDLVPAPRWAAAMVEGMRWDLRATKAGRTIGQYLGYFGPRHIWTWLDPRGLGVALAVHELEHMRDHVLSGLTYRQWAKANAEGRHHLDPEETARVIAWCTAQLGDFVGRT